MKKESDASLLDVNVLIALFDEEHTHDDAAHRWPAANLAQGWASCPLTENGVFASCRAPATAPLFGKQRVDVAQRLREFMDATDHEFWPDELSAFGWRRRQRGADVYHISA